MLGAAININKLIVKIVYKKLTILITIIMIIMVMNYLNLVKRTL